MPKTCRPLIASAEPLQKINLIRRNLIQTKEAAVADSRIGRGVVFDRDNYSWAVRRKRHPRRDRQSVVDTLSVPSRQNRYVYRCCSQRHSQVFRKVRITVARGNLHAYQDLSPQNPGSDPSGSALKVVAIIPRDYVYPEEGKCRTGSQIRRIVAPLVGSALMDT